MQFASMARQIRRKKQFVYTLVAQVALQLYMGAYARLLYSDREWPI
jgi:hypothetical protein